MTRLALLLVLIVFVARAFWRLFDGVIEGLTGGQGVGAPRAKTPARVQMERDPVCGTFVLPERAAVLGDGQHNTYFCSVRCRDAYRAGRSSAEWRSAASAAGRTA